MCYDDNVMYIRIDKEDGTTTKINKIRLKQVLSNYYKEVDIVVKAIDSGNKIPTDFAIYSKD